MRTSNVITSQDSAGSYEMEIFDCPNPKNVIVCSHGNGVRRWDGEDFFYMVAEHYSDSAVILVDQNQPVGDGVSINPLPILVSRVNAALQQAKKQYPLVPLAIIGHSMGCGVVAQLELEDVSAVLFVAPAVGTPAQSLIERYGSDIVHGKTVKTTDGLTKIITAEYYESVKNIDWEDEYTKLVERYSPVYVYEAGDDEILGESRFAHRQIPFTSYDIIQGAKHNFSGKSLNDLFRKIDLVLAKGEL